MCFVHSPKDNAQVSPPEFLHNQFLDGQTDGMGLTMGRNSLRIDMGSPTTSGVNPGATAAPVPGQGSSPDIARSPTSGGQVPIGMAAANNFRFTSPGVVVPTIGGSLAGSVPGAVAK